ncbi:MAG: LuxR C-terminal-related transcriptional regulator [Spirochaetales bacterium]|nr:LuxR C-terminal-related transcriptional regulator [Spirochaetales bacterium]
MSVEEAAGETHPDTFLSVPGSWEGMVLDGVSLPREGYGTLRLRILLPPDTGPYGIVVPSCTQPIALYINGTRRAAIGHVAATAQEARYDSSRQVVPLHSDESDVDLLIHISNFHYRRIAGQRTFTIGRLAALSEAGKRRTMIDFVLIGACFIMALYHGAFFLSDRTARQDMLFAIICALLALRWSIVDGGYAGMIVPDFGWLVRSRIDRGTQIALAFVFPFYLKELFPYETRRWTRRVSSTVWILCFALIVFSDHDRYLLNSYLYLRLIDLLSIGALLYFLFVKIEACVRRREGALTCLVTYTIAGTAIVYEMYASYAYDPAASIWYRSLYGTVLIVLFQSFCNMRRHRRLVRETQTLRDELSPLRVKLLSLRDKRREIMHYLDGRTDRERLTPREKEIILMIVNNKKNREIAEQLYISYHTVRRHINNINRKLNVTSREGLMERLGR